MIDCISYDDFKTLLSGQYAEYYAGRWEYFKEIIAIIQGLPAKRILEIGPGRLPIVYKADVLLNPQYDQFGRRKNILEKRSVMT